MRIYEDRLVDYVRGHRREREITVDVQADGMTQIVLRVVVEHTSDRTTRMLIPVDDARQWLNAWIEANASYLGIAERVEQITAGESVQFSEPETRGSSATCTAARTGLGSFIY